jgi:hypothetical protein
MDPGYSFERRGFINRYRDGCRYHLGVGDRPRPGDTLKDILVSYSVRTAGVPDELRRLAGDAWTNSATRPHWRDALTWQAPDILHAWPDTSDMTVAAEVTARTAREKRLTCYLCWASGQAGCVTAPPRGPEGFLSVTPLGTWSIHQGRSTYPVSGQPGARMFDAMLPYGFARAQLLARIPEQVQLARQDVPDVGPPTIPSTEQEPGRPAR